MTIHLFCDMRCDCEDKQGCDIYYSEKNRQQLEEQYIENWKEREYAEMEAS